MTIAATRSHVFDVATIIRMAWRESGLLSIYMDVSEQQAATGLDFLRLIVASTETQGMFARDVEFETITLVDGTSEYPLDASTIDCTGDAMYFPAGETEIATPVKLIGRERWQTLGTWSEGGIPTYYYIHRTADVVEAWIWPPPGANEDTATVRLQSHRLRADMTPTTVTMDFEGYWTEYFVAALAMKLARVSGRDLGTVQDLAASAAAALAKCRGKSNEGRAQQFVLRHGRAR